MCFFLPFFFFLPFSSKAICIVNVVFEDDINYNNTHTLIEWKFIQNPSQLKTAALVIAVHTNSSSASAMAGI